VKELLRFIHVVLKKSTGIETDITFDLTTFQTKIDPSLDVHSLNGLSE